MNYTVYADNHLIFNRQVIGENGSVLYNMIDPVLSETNDRFSTFSYKAVKGSPAYEYVGHLNTKIKIYRDGALYWTGRVFDVSPTINNVCSIMCEDILGVLNDTIVRPYSWNGHVNDFLEFLVNQHNSQVEDSSRMISAVWTDVDDSIIRSSSVYNNTWTEVKTKILDKLGGYMWVEYDNNESPILYYSRQAKSQIHQKNVQKVKFARNIVTYNVNIKSDELYTACVPLGARYVEGDGSDDNPRVEKRLTIESVNDGKDYLINSEAAEIYGVIYAPVDKTTWNDITVPSNLLLRGQSWILNESARFIRSINVSSVDMSGIEANVREFEWLDLSKCEAPDFDELMVIKSISRDIGNPYNVTISFGDIQTSLTGKTASNMASTIERIDLIEADYVTNEEAHSVAEETIENSSMIQQLPEQIMTTVSEQYTSKTEFEEFSQQTSTQISQLPNEFQILFTQVLEGAGLDVLSAYLRVLNGNLHLGRSDSEIKACLKNDILLFYTGADETASIDTALAYFSSGKLYVKTVQIRSLTIGTSGSEFDISVVGGGRNRCLFISGRGE